MCNFESVQMSYNVSNETVDTKITKRHFPKCNNHNILEFVFEKARFLTKYLLVISLIIVKKPDKDPNLYLRKNSIIIKGAIELDEEYIVENGWVSKLFSQLKVEVDSQVVTRNSNR